MELEDLAAATTSCEPEDKQKQHKEEQKGEEEERAEIEAAKEKWRNLMRSRMEFLRRTGQPIKIMPLHGYDVRRLLNRKSNCDEINWGNEPVDKESLLEKENALWNAAMEYRKVQNMVFDYDLIPSNMTLFPIMSKDCMWYHCNLVGSKREFPSKGAQQHFFLEVNMSRGKTYNVTACITLDDDVGDTCKACPSHSGILHPCKGGFTFGSKKGPSKEDVGATPPTLGDETSGPVTRRQLELALAGGGISGPFPPAAATRSTPLMSSRLNRSLGPITKRRLELALASALESLSGGGSSSDSSSPMQLARS